MTGIYVQVLAFVFVVVATTTINAQTTAFTYQGKLTDSSLPANGVYEMQFSLFDTVTDGTQIGPTITNNSVIALTGIFTVQLDFTAPNAFDGNSRWLEIAVKKPADPSFTILSPRQPLTSVPYAVKSMTATSADSLSNACSLCITDAHIQSMDGSKVTGSVASASTAGTATTAQNVTGVVAIANGGTGSASKNFVDLSTNQTNIGGNKTFTGAVAVTGAGGVFNGNGSGLTNLNGANITSNSVTSEQISVEALPASTQLNLLGALRWDRLKGQRVYNANASAYGIAFDGSNVWVTNANNPGTVTKLNGSDGSIIGTYPVGNFPQAAAFDGSNVWVANTVSNTVTKLRASDGACVGTCTFPVGTNPVAMAFDGDNMWIVNSGSNNVTRLRGSDGACVSTCTFAVGVNPRGIAYDGTFMWITNFGSNTISRKHAPSGNNFAAVSIPAGPRGIAFDGTSMWIANASGSTITKLRALDTVCVAPCTFSIPNFPPKDVVFDGTAIWVTQGTGNALYRVRIADGSVVGPHFYGLDTPAGIAFDGSHVWVTHPAEGAVVRLKPSFTQP